MTLCILVSNFFLNLDPNKIETTNQALKGTYLASHAF